MKLAIFTEELRHSLVLAIAEQVADHVEILGARVLDGKLVTFWADVPALENIRVEVDIEQGVPGRPR